MFRYALALACIWHAQVATAVRTESQVQTEQLLTERINLKTLQSTLSQLWVLEPFTLAGAGTIASGEDEAQVFTEGDFIYVQGSRHEGNGKYHIFRRLGTYQDPVSSELLGLEVVLIGSAEQVNRQGRQQVLQITTADEPILIGHRLIPASWQTQLEERLIPTEARTSAQGQIIAKVGLNNNIINVEDVVAINLGVREGLNNGDLISVLKPAVTKAHSAEQGVPTRRPWPNIGLIYVLQTFVKMSYGVVLRADAEIKAGDHLCVGGACEGKI